MKNSNSKRMMIISFALICFFIVIGIIVFKSFKSKNIFLQSSEIIQPGIMFGASSDVRYAGEPTETKTCELSLYYDEAINTSEKQYIDFLKERVLGRAYDWYIVDLMDRGTCIVYYGGDARQGYYCKARDTYTVSKYNLTKENPNLYGIVYWNEDTVTYKTIEDIINSPETDSSELSINNGSIADQINKINVICAGGDVSAVIDNESNLWMWGDNSNGQLGITSSSMQLSDIPIKVMEDIKDVSIGGSHTAAIKADGTLWMWGSNSSGQLGNGSEGKGLYEPIKVMDQVTSVSLGPDYTAAIKTDGTLWMWGGNSLGQLGIGSDQYGNLDDSSIPIKIMDNVLTVSAGSSHTAAIKTDNSLWVWGSNNSGELGDPYIGNNTGFITCQDVPVQIMNDVMDVSVGSEFTAVIKTDGSLWTWGYNGSGQLGIGSDGASVSTPTKVMDNMVSISAEGSTMAAIQNDGSLWMWGVNTGKFGNGEVKYSLSPIKVMDMVTAVDLGLGHTIVIKKDGSFWLWGNSDCGQLGNGMTSAYIDSLNESDTQDDFVDLGNGLWIGPSNWGRRGPYQTTPIQIQLK